MLYIFVEGPDDEKFISNVYSGKFGIHEFVRYAHMNNEKIISFIKSIKCMPSCDYVFLADADGKQLAEKKNCLLDKYPILTEDKIYVVQYEIESWYYAGLDRETCRKLKMKDYVCCTDTMTKEQFNAKLYRLSERQYIMSKMLDLYSIDLAVNRNSSLSDFNLYFSI